LFIKAQGGEEEVNGMGTEEGLETREPLLVESKAHKGVEVLLGQNETFLSENQVEGLVVLDLKEEWHEDVLEGEVSIGVVSHQEVLGSHGLSDSKGFNQVAQAGEALVSYGQENGVEV
jgi:hypothetical protein